MFCPECGRELEEDMAFCPQCGRMRPESHPDTTSFVTTSETVTTTYPVYTPPESNRSVQIFLVLAVAIAVIGAAIALPLLQGSIHGSLQGQSFSVELGEDSYVGSESRSIILGNGFDSEDASFEFTDGNATITLSEALLSAKGNAIWSLKRYNDNISDYESDGLSLTLPVTSAHRYGDFTAKAVFSDSSALTFTLSSLVFRSYEWKYDGGSFTLQAEIPWEEYEAQKNSTIDRISSNYLASHVSDYVLVTDTVTAIENGLRALHTKAYGNTQNDQDYADFILGYVQLCYTYEYDSGILYHQDEYFALPVQTIAQLGGDCEDTSILAAALYKAAGYSAAILLLPEHAMVGVALDNYSKPTLSSGEILKGTVGTVTYYAGETTLDSFQQVGVSAGEYNGKYYSYWIDTPGNGFFPAS